MAENEAHKLTRRMAADRLWQLQEREAAGALRRCTLTAIWPGRAGGPVIWLRGGEADARLLRGLTQSHNRQPKPGALDRAFADVLPQFTQWPRFHFDVVDDWSQVVA